MNAVAATAALALSRPACRRAIAAFARFCSLGHGFFKSIGPRFAVICAQIAYTYRHTAYKATARTIPRLPPCTSVSCACSHNSCSRSGFAKSSEEHSTGARQRANQSKKGPRKRIPAPPRLTGAGAREQVPESHRPPPGATPRGPGRSGFPATSQRGSEVYGPHIIRAGHGRVRRLARVTARGGAVRDEDH